MMNEINVCSTFPERIVLKNDKGEMLAYVPHRTCKMKDNWDNVVCSACGEIMFGMKVTNYCPNCGAKVVE